MSPANFYLLLHFFVIYDMFLQRVSSYTGNILYIHVTILIYVYFSLFSLPAGDLHLQLQTNKGSVCFSPNLPMYIIVKFQ